MGISLHNLEEHVVSCSGNLDFDVPSLAVKNGSNGTGVLYHHGEIVPDKFYVMAYQPTTALLALVVSCPLLHFLHIKISLLVWIWNIVP